LLRPPSRQSVRRLEGIQSFAQNSKPEGCCTWDPSPGFCSQRCSAGASFLLPIIYPNVGQEVVSFAFWGLLIVASVQPAKVLNSGLGQRDFTKWRGHEVCSFKPSDRELSCWASLLSGLLMGLNLWGVYGSRCAEEIIKPIFFLGVFAPTTGTASRKWDHSSCSSRSFRYVNDDVRPQTVQIFAPRTARGRKTSVRCRSQCIRGN
jgi:hypothetical protein